MNTKFQGLLNMEIKVGMATGPHQVSSACPLMAQHLNAKLAQFVRGSNWVVNSSHQLADLGGPNSCRSTRVCGFLHTNVAMSQGQMQFAWVGTLGTELDVVTAFQAWQIIPHTFDIYTLLVVIVLVCNRFARVTHDINFLVCQTMAGLPLDAVVAYLRSGPRWRAPGVVPPPSSSLEPKPPRPQKSTQLPSTLPLKPSDPQAIFFSCLNH